MLRLMPPRFSIVGRSSSHFTRVLRLFAHELAQPHDFEIVHDLRSLELADYAQNPALRLPILKADDEVWFGALSGCRRLARAASQPRRIVWPEQLQTPLVSNAQELTTQAMATEVELIMSQDAAAPSRYLEKRRASLEHSLSWLDARLDAALAELPERDVSYLEVSLFCLIEHLEFREVVSVAALGRLKSFCDEFAERASARATPFVFDRPRTAPSS